MIDVTGKKGSYAHKWTHYERGYLAGICKGRTHAEIQALMTERFGDHFGGKRIGAALKRYGLTTGRTGQFQPGDVPANKGKKWAEYAGKPQPEGMKRTQFKRGELNGYAAQHEKPVGSERISKDGYVEIKVHDGLQERANSNFALKHRVMYEQYHGSIPDGCNVVFANGDKRDFSRENLVAVPRSLWAVISRSGMKYCDADSLKACMNVAKLKSGINRVKLAPRACRACGRTFTPRNERQRTCDACLGHEKKGQQDGREQVDGHGARACQADDEGA